RDDSIRYFIDSIPTFEQVKREFISTGTFRLASLRSLKVLKYFYDQGIDITRLKGTGMSFSSKSKEEEERNRECTFTVDKIKKAPSVYEYHYGKPKPPESKGQ